MGLSTKVICPIQELSDLKLKILNFKGARKPSRLLWLRKFCKCIQKILRRYYFLERDVQLIKKTRGSTTADFFDILRMLIYISSADLLLNSVFLFGKNPANVSSQSKFQSLSIIQTSDDPSVDISQQCSLFYHVTLQGRSSALKDQALEFFSGGGWVMLRTNFFYNSIRRFAFGKVESKAYLIASLAIFFTISFALLIKNLKASIVLVAKRRKTRKNKITNIVLANWNFDEGNKQTIRRQQKTAFNRITVGNNY